MRLDLTPQPYDYTDHVLRTDPTVPPTAADVDDAADLAAAYGGGFAATAAVIDGIWAQFDIDLAALAAMAAVRYAFTNHAEQRGICTWAGVTDDVVADFVAVDGLADAARRLRKNTVHACYLALADAGLHDGGSPAAGIDPVPDELRDDQRGKRLGNPKPKREKLRRTYAERTHVRPATHDEVLLVRLASRLAGTSRGQHRCAAAVAVATTGGTTAEGARLLWRHARTDPAELRLAGRPPVAGREETEIVSRTLPLDDWAAIAIADWWQERSTVRNATTGEAPVLYTGDKELTSNSAQICVDQQIRAALTIADLRREPGLTAGSLRYWAAARHVTDLASLETGAHIAGIAPLTLHRHVTQQGDRGLYRNH